MEQIPGTMAIPKKFLNFPGKLFGTEIQETEKLNITKR